MATAVPGNVRAVVIGGGIVGCATAYQLVRLGWKDVVVLERHKLTSGSTFHAAGLVGQLRSSARVTELLGQSVALYERLERETGLATGWKKHGGLQLACNQERWIELKRQATTARSFGLEMHLLSASEAKQMWPLMQVDDVVGAAFLPTDGQANPSDITQALAKAVRTGGGRTLEGVEVTGIEVQRGRVAAVQTSAGRIACEVAVNCGGQWAREVGAMAGVNVPLVSVQHQYMITEPIDGIPRDLPTLRDPDRLTYYKEEVGGLVMGGYEPDPIPWAVDGLPHDTSFHLLDSNWEHFSEFIDKAVGRVPALRDVGVRTLVNGPEAFTPDGMFILGEAPEVRNFFVGAGFNAFGIAAGGGAGIALGDWIVNGRPPFDLWAVDIRRFGQPHHDIEWVRKRTLELYGKHYSIAWPNEEHQSGRPCRISPLYAKLKGQGACFGEKLGWERPNWFAAPGTEAKDIYTFGRPNWFDAVGREHRATRERVAVFDQTSFSKFLLIGPDAEAALNWICANDTAKPVGTITYTQLLNDKGGIECDLTITRLAEDRFYIVTGTGFTTHDADWIARNIRAGAHAQLVDVTSSRAVIAVMGPRARDVLSRVSRRDFGNAAFPFATGQRISIAGAPVLALRITFVGELGWEMHLPTECAVPVYDAIMEAGSEFGIANAGYRAIESLRLEKGYRVWGSDIGPDYSALEAGLGFAVKLSTDTPFQGREALEKQAREGLHRRLVGFSVDSPDAILLGKETVLRNGQQVGWLTSGGFGYTLGKPIGYGYVSRSDGVVDTDYLKRGQYELVIAGETVPCKIHLRAPYDPKMEHIKG